MAPFTSPQPWPNALDAVATTVFLAIAMLLPLAGYTFMLLDIRAYLRSLRRGLAVIGGYLRFPRVPDWARHHTPRAVAAFGLQLPCTEEDLMRAYRARVKHLHPDHGGDGRRFLMLQANFEEALSLVRAASPCDDAGWSCPRSAA